MSYFSKAFPKGALGQMIGTTWMIFVHSASCRNFQELIPPSEFCFHNLTVVQTVDGEDLVKNTPLKFSIEPENNLLSKRTFLFQGHFPLNMVIFQCHVSFQGLLFR